MPTPQQDHPFPIVRALLLRMSPPFRSAGFRGKIETEIASNLKDLRQQHMFDTSQPSYRALRDIVAEKTSPLLAWVGSGASAPAGLPTWPALREALCSDLDAKLATLDPAEIGDLRAAAQFARRERNLWIAIGAVRKAIGDTSYIASVRRALEPTLQGILPRLYSDLWNLGISGLLSLNLDRFAARAFGNLHPGRGLIEFSGRAAADHVHVLQAATPFVANLHGILEQVSSWVLTHDQLRQLVDDASYQVFLTSCLTTRTLLFVGIGADDLAVGGLLQRLSDLGISANSHYWMTARNDRETDEWAEHNGVQVIRYSGEDNHAELADAFRDLLAFVPSDSVPPRVMPPRHPGEEDFIVPSPERIIALPAERIREILNTRAADILQGGDDTADGAYDLFVSQYDEAIYRAWYVTQQAPNNTLLGYRLIEPASAGAFGRVFRAEDHLQRVVAIKILHSEIRRNTEMLQGFRRGVRSMQILADRRVKGMVQYYAASEIPACVVMEFIEGPDLNEAIGKRLVGGWREILRIGFELATIIQRAHQLPERVLHRDIRPSNVMLKGLYNDDDDWNVVVLDFDLSWHRDAKGMSMDNARSTNGYLAPEQVSASKKHSTRNALVDSFGLGMTLYFMRSGNEPLFAQHRHKNWREVLRDSVASYQAKEWHSLPRRFARLIERATMDDQSARADMSQIVGELFRLRQAFCNPKTVEATDLLAEELAARAEAMCGIYAWDSDKAIASLSLPTGAEVSIQANESARQLIAELSWTDKGFADRKRVGKWIPRACDEAAASLSKAGFSARVEAKTASLNRVVGTIPASLITVNLEDTAKAIDRAIAAFRLE